ncbi:hypothetical protein SAMN04515617_13716 [Collimonas sp. OK242]|jgi:hypothetical protein|uniref:hypothetical protein n=1 Tax=Collimonas sp. OK242 TaxID=1798195 RepID=UPI000896DD03|nr:hypothetical protein [Collimonas sp. OK242]SDY96761.1 hypothetical protein SAMN04515617_13716 [Collimonas sp. OK242]
MLKPAIRVGLIETLILAPFFIPRPFPESFGPALGMIPVLWFFVAARLWLTLTIASPVRFSKMQSTFGFIFAVEFAGALINLLIVAWAQQSRLSLIYAGIAIFTQFLAASYSIYLDKQSEQQPASFKSPQTTEPSLSVWILINSSLSGLLAFIGVILFHVPVIGIPLVLLSFPVLSYFPQLGKSGPDINYTFLYVSLQSPFSFGVIWSYFFICIFAYKLVAFFLIRRRTKPK